MSTAADHLEMVLSLDSRHDDLLERLDDLDQKVASVLAEHLPARAVAPQPDPAVEQPEARNEGACSPADNQ